MHKEPEALNLREGDRMLSKSFLPPLDILLVPDDSLLRVCAKQLAETMDVPASFQNIQSHSAFPIIFRQCVVFSRKQQRQVLRLHTEDALVVQERCPLEFVQYRSIDPLVVHVIKLLLVTHAHFNSND